MTETTELQVPAEEPRIKLMSDYDPKPEQEAESDTVAEEAQPEPETAEVEEPEAQPEPEKKRDAQSRIRELNARAKAAEERAAALEAQLNVKNKQPESGSQQQQGLVKPNPADYVGGRFNDDYQDAYEAYTEAAAEVRVQAALEQREAAKSVEATVKTIQQRENEFRAQHDDYDDALSYVMESGVIDHKFVFDAIIDMPNSPEIVYKIGNDEALLHELAGLSPAMRLMRIGQLTAQTTHPAAPRQMSKAPPPVEPVKGGTAPILAGEAAMDAALKAGDYDAYRAAKRGIK